MSFPASNRLNPLNDDELSDLTKEEILYWSRKLEVTPSELFALSASELEQHLSCAYSDALKEQHQEMHSREWSEFSDLKRRLKDYKNEGRLKGGQTSTYKNIWAILAQAAMEIDKLCGAGKKNKMERDNPITPSVQEVYSNVANINPADDIQTLQSFSRSNTLPRSKINRVNQGRASMSKKEQAARYAAMRQAAPQIAPPPSNSYHDSNNAYNTAYGTTIPPLSSPSLSNEQVVSAQSYSVLERQSSPNSYLQQNTEIYGAGLQTSQPESSGKQRRFLNTRSPTNSGMGPALSPDSYTNAPSKQRSLNHSNITKRGRANVAKRYEYEHLLKQQQGHEMARANPFVYSVNNNMASPTRSSKIMQQKFYENYNSRAAARLAHSMQYYPQSDSCNVSPVASKKSMPRRTSSEEYGPTQHVSTSHLSQTQSKPETRSCSSSASGSPTTSSFRLPLTSCLKRSDSTSRRSSRSITFDPRFCQNTTPPESENGDIYIETDAQDNDEDFNEEVPPSHSSFEQHSEGTKDPRKPIVGHAKNYGDYYFVHDNDPYKGDNQNAAMEY